MGKFVSPIIDVYKNSEGTVGLFVLFSQPPFSPFFSTLFFFFLLAQVALLKS